MNVSQKIALPALMMFALAGTTVFATDAMSRPMGPCGGPAMMDCDEMGGPCGGPAMGRGMGRGMFSAEQQKKYDAILAEFAPKMEPLREAIFVKKHELRALENAAQPDMKAVDAAAKELYQLRTDMGKAHDELRARIAKEVGRPENAGPRQRGPRGDKNAPDNMPMEPMHNSGHGNGHY